MNKREELDTAETIEKIVLIALIPISLFRWMVLLIILSLIELGLIIYKNKLNREIEEYKNKLYEDLEDFKIEVDDNLYKLYGNFASTDILEGEEYIVNAKRDD